ncbi:hypothetical protein FA95DRAFT_57279 [Auriscalpium vulgare]|uniref:Uncharacterized protein n=1 Tax=Auriscalpium vulgare TaxID=40419 RepID=A0ACB8S6C5_9AGAM|nr:hypothetical protein FA95DRAFT_57279 [Auriscalpium vulgare]
MAGEHNTTVVVVDDADSGVSYSSGWVVNNAADAAYNYEGTLHGSGGEAGASATFRFQGSAVEVHGMISRTDGAAAATYRLDDLPPVTLGLPAVNATLYGVLFYRSPPLDARTEHTLVVTPAGRLWLDYLLYTPAPKRATRLLRSPAVIAGIATGAAVVLALLLVLAYVLWLRHKRSQYRGSRDTVAAMLGPELGLATPTRVQLRQMSEAAASSSTNTFAGTHGWAGARPGVPKVLHSASRSEPVVYSQSDARPPVSTSSLQHPQVPSRETLPVLPLPVQTRPRQDADGWLVMGHERPVLIS